MTSDEAREFMAGYFHAAMQEDDLHIFAGLFAEEGVLEDPVGAPPLRGRAAIREFVGAGRALIERSSFEVLDVKVCGDECAVRWASELHTFRGDTLKLDGIGIFMFAGPGQLRHVKEYYDASPIMKMFAAAGAAT